MQKKVTELYIVDALSFTEAESRIIGEMSCHISGDFDVVSEKITNYSELVEGQGDKWYKVKLNLVTLDEKSGAEKKSPVYLLVQAPDIDGARKRLNEHMSGTVADWVCEAVQETKIMDVFLYAPDAPYKDFDSDFDSIPDGQKVTIRATGCKDVVADKTNGHEKAQDDA